MPISIYRHRSISKLWVCWVHKMSSSQTASTRKQETEYSIEQTYTTSSVNYHRWNNRENYDNTPHPQDIHSTSTGLPQDIHSTSTRHPQDIHEQWIFTGHPHNIHRTSTNNHRTCTLHRTCNIHKTSGHPRSAVARMFHWGGSVCESSEPAMRGLFWASEASSLRPPQPNFFFRFDRV